MGLKINGSTSGSIEIDVPAVAGTDTSITIPAKNGGTFIVEESTGNIDLGPLDINGSASDDSVNIDGSGRLLVGTTTDTNNIRLNQKFSVVREGAYGGASFVTYGGTGADSAAHFDIKRSRGSTDGTMTSVALNDLLGSFQFLGADGTNFVRAAQINCEVDGTPGTNDMPSRLLFGVTADGESSPTERIKIRNNGWLQTNSSVYGCTVHVVGTSYNIFEGYSGATAGSYNGTNHIYIRYNGDVKNTNNSYGAISDLKLKENVVDAASQWDDVKAIQVRNYNFKEETGYETHTQLGVVAQEIELVSPGLVQDEPDRDSEGNDLGTFTKTVNYSVLYMKAVKALQEAMERIETLETRLTALENA